MAFVDVAIGVGIGALAGGAIAGITGGNVLNGALMGAGVGGLGGAGYAAFGGVSAAELAGADAIATSMGFPTAAYAMNVAGIAPEALGLAPGITADALMAASSSATGSLGTVAQSAAPLEAAGNTAAAPFEANYPTPGQLAGPNPNIPASTNAFATTDANSYGPGWSSAGFQGGAKSPSMFSGVTNFVKEHPYLTAAGVGGTAYLLGSQGKSLTQPNYLPTYTPPSAGSYGLGQTLSSSYRPTRTMADGGIASLKDGNLMQTGPAQVNFMGNDMYPQSQIHRSYYATPTQMPTSAQTTMASYEPKTNPLTGEITANMAIGGITAAGQTGLQNTPKTMDPMYIQQLANQFNTTPQVAQQGLQALQTTGIARATGGSVGNKYNLGSYSDGGRLLKGPGDGMSDNIPASIADKQPARLADGEFVVPADVVSHLGNGSTDAGAKHLYKMMDNVRNARTGRKAQGKKIKADKYLPK
jgi:hypothetical protein